MLTLLLLSQSLLNSHGWSPLRFASRISSRPISASSSAGTHGDRRFVPSRPKRIKHALHRVIPFWSSNRDDSDFSLLQSENSVLRDTIRQLEEENQRLKQRAQRMVGLENFEGERFFRDEFDRPTADMGGITLTGEEIAQDELWCDQLEEGKGD